jgi:hypothetical protein
MISLRRAKKLNHNIRNRRKQKSGERWKNGTTNPITGTNFHFDIGMVSYSMPEQLKVHSLLWKGAILEKVPAGPPGCFVAGPVFPVRKGSGRFK